MALEIGRAWGVGAKAEVGDPRRNAGIVVLLVPRQGGVPGTGRLRIEVGQGLEGIVTDAIAGRIRDLMGDRLASGRLQRRDPGRRRGAGQHHRARLRRQRHRAHQRPSGRRQPRGTRGTPFGALPILLFILFLVISGAFRRSAGAGGATYIGGGPWIGGGLVAVAVGAGVGEGSAAVGSGASAAAADSAAAAPEGDSDARRGGSSRRSPFLSQADAALGNGYSAVLYGSAARGDYVPGRSDLNLIARHRRSLAGAALRARRPHSRRGASRATSRPS